MYHCISLNNQKGRQLFEKDRTLADSDATLMNKGDEGIDLRKFEKQNDEDNQEEQLVEFSDPEE